MGSREGEPSTGKHLGKGRDAPYRSPFLLTASEAGQLHPSPIIQVPSWVAFLSVNTTLESENLCPERPIMVIRPNQHLVLANRRSGQEPLYVHTSPLGMLRLQATKGSASFRSRLLDHRSCLSNISTGFALSLPPSTPNGGSLRMKSREIREPPEEEPRTGLTGTREKRVRNLGQEVSGTCPRCSLSAFCPRAATGARATS